MSANRARKGRNQQCPSSLVSRDASAKSQSRNVLVTVRPSKTTYDRRRSPKQLRERAAAIRWAAKTMADVARVRRLRELADELEARAAALEAKET